MIAKKADDDDDQYDHDFEPEERCTTCDEVPDNCECEDDEEEYVETEVCAVCGNDQSDPVHGDG